MDAQADPLYESSIEPQRATLISRNCNSLVLQSSLVFVLATLLIVPLAALASIVPELPGAYQFTLLVAAVPAVIYWWRLAPHLPRNMFIHARTLAIDLETQTLAYTETWVFGLRKTRTFRLDQLQRFVHPANFLSGIRASIHITGQAPVTLDAEYFNLLDILGLVRKYLPDLPTEKLDF